MFLQCAWHRAVGPCGLTFPPSECIPWGSSFLPTLGRVSHWTPQAVEPALHLHCATSWFSRSCLLPFCPLSGEPLPGGGGGRLGVWPVSESKCVCVVWFFVFFFPPSKSFVFMNESSVEVAESPTHSALTHPPSAEESRGGKKGGVLAENEGQSLSRSASHRRRRKRRASPRSPQRRSSDHHSQCRLLHSH